MSDTPSQAPVKSIMPEWITRSAGFRRRPGADGHRAVRLVGIERSAGHARIFVRRRNRAAHVRRACCWAWASAVDGRRHRDRRTASGDLCLARAAVRLAGDRFLCGHDPPAGPGGLGLRELHDLGARHAGNAMERSHHRRRLPDDRLQPAVSLRAGAADAAAARVSWCSEGAMADLFSNLGLGFHVVFQFVPSSPSWLGGFSIPIPSTSCCA